MGLSEAGKRVHDFIVGGTSSVDERLLVLRVVAEREGATEDDIRDVKAIFLEGRVRHCRH